MSSPRSGSCCRPARAACAGCGHSATATPVRSAPGRGSPRRRAVWSRISLAAVTLASGEPDASTSAIASSAFVGHLPQPVCGAGSLPPIDLAEVVTAVAHALDAGLRQLPPWAFLPPPVRSPSSAAGGRPRFPCAMCGDANAPRYRRTERPRRHAAGAGGLPDAARAQQDPAQHFQALNYVVCGALWRPPNSPLVRWSRTAARWRHVSGGQPSRRKTRHPPTCGTLPRRCATSPLRSRPFRRCHPRSRTVRSTWSRGASGTATAAHEVGGRDATDAGSGGGGTCPDSQAEARTGQAGPEGVGSAGGPGVPGQRGRCVRGECREAGVPLGSPDVSASAAIRLALRELAAALPADEVAGVLLGGSAALRRPGRKRL